MGRIRHNQGRVQASAYSKITAQLKEDIRVTIEIFAQVALLALPGPVYHRTLFDAELFESAQDDLANQLITALLALKQFAIELDTSVGTAGSGQFYHLSDSVVLINTGARAGPSWTQRQTLRE